MRSASSSTLCVLRRPAQRSAASAQLQPKTSQNPTGCRAFQAAVAPSGAWTWPALPALSLYVGASVDGARTDRCSAANGIHPAGPSTRTSNRAGIIPSCTSDSANTGSSDSWRSRDDGAGETGGANVCSPRACSTPTGTSSRSGSGSNLDGGAPMAGQIRDGPAGEAGAKMETTQELQSLLVEDTTVDSWRTPLRRPGSVVALGKFDALHRGHQALATAAAALARHLAVQRSAAAATPVNPDCSPIGSFPGANSRCTATPGCGNVLDLSAVRQPAAAAVPRPPLASQSPPLSYRDATPSYCRTTSGNDGATGEAVLLSFSGMAAVLGWPDRLPLTAPQDRGRVLASWGPACAGARRSWTPAQHAQHGVPGQPRLRTMPFSMIRSMSPEQFVELLARDLGAAGVVAGRNYRFGYKAAGDADTLVRLGRQYGMHVEIVDLVLLPDNGQRGDENHGSRTSSCTTVTDSEDDSAVPGSNTGARDRLADGVVGEALEGSYSIPYASSDVAEADSFSAASTDLDVEIRPQRRLPVAAGVASGGSGGCDDNGPRVSSSRIRALLERGQVESVEQLLGRKYRLVCDLRGAFIASYSTYEVFESVSASKSHDRGNKNGAERVLTVPYAAFQNQPPANGQYRALVWLAAGFKALIEDDAEVVSESMAGYVSAAVGAFDADKVIQYACTLVTLSEAGIEVIMPSEFLDVPKSGSSLLLVDFDACE